MNSLTTQNTQLIPYLKSRRQTVLLCSSYKLLYFNNTYLFNISYIRSYFQPNNDNVPMKYTFRRLFCKIKLRVRILLIFIESHALKSTIVKLSTQTYREIYKDKINIKISSRNINNTASIYQQWEHLITRQTRTCTIPTRCNNCFLLIP